MQQMDPEVLFVADLNLGEKIWIDLIGHQKY